MTYKGLIINKGDYEPTSFDLIESLPTTPGIYAWYYIPTISKADIDEFIQKTLKTSQDVEERKELVRQFLNKRVFDYLKEEPYGVTLTGKLKPTYEGKIDQAFNMTPELLRRVSEEPERLFKIAEHLKTSIPVFASPIYIGMSDNLRTRLVQHKQAMERYHNNSFTEAELIREIDSNNKNDEEKKRKNFAYEVVKIRGFRFNNLRLFYKETNGYETEQGNLSNDLENILNRINYPLCGRN